MLDKIGDTEHTEMNPSIVEEKKLANAKETIVFD